MCCVSWLSAVCMLCLSPGLPLVELSSVGCHKTASSWGLHPHTPCIIKWDLLLRSHTKKVSVISDLAWAPERRKWIPFQLVSPGLSLEQFTRDTRSQRVPTLRQKHLLWCEFVSHYPLVSNVLAGWFIAATHEIWEVYILLTVMISITGYKSANQ